MSPDSDISTLYREFTDALTEILAENAVGPARRGRLARGRAAVKRHPDYSEAGHFLAVVLHSRIGKTCKTLVVRTALAGSGHRACIALAETCQNLVLGCHAPTPARHCSDRRNCGSSWEKTGQGLRVLD